MVAGWPGRAGRSSFGPTMHDERLVDDTERHFVAYQANLTFWQLGAIGIVAPLATFSIEDRGDGDFGMSYGAFAWDQTLHLNLANNVYPSYFTFVEVSEGIYTVEFDAQVLGRPDENGIPQMESLAIRYGRAIAQPNNPIGQRFFAEFELTDAQNIEIRLSISGSPNGDNFMVKLW